MWVPRLEYLFILCIPGFLIRAHQFYIWFVTYYVMWPQIELAYPQELDKLGTKGWFASNILFQGELAQYLIAKEYRKVGSADLNSTCDPLSRWYEFYYRWQLKLAPLSFVALWVFIGLGVWYVIRNAT